MAEYSIKDTTLTGMADQIRTMHGTTDAMAPSTMITKLQEANSAVTEQEQLLVEITNTLQNKAVNACSSTRTCNVRIHTSNANRYFAYRCTRLVNGIKSIERVVGITSSSGYNTITDVLIDEPFYVFASVVGAPTITLTNAVLIRTYGYGVAEIEPACTIGETAMIAIE